MCSLFFWFHVVPIAFPLQFPNHVESCSGHGVKLKDVKAGFPLPGQYHFRFKMKWECGPWKRRRHKLERFFYRRNSKSHSKVWCCVDGLRLSSFEFSLHPHYEITINLVQDLLQIEKNISKCALFCICPLLVSGRDQ